MKKIVSVFLCLMMVLSSGSMLFVDAADKLPNVSGTIYYVDSQNGKDSNDGKSDQNAFQTPARVFSVALNAGDAVLFKRGGTYECTSTLTVKGTASEPVLISAYGEGNAPLLTTQQNTEVLKLFDSSYVTISNLEITAHNGGGIWIDTLNETSEGITIDHVKFHDIQNYEATSRDNLSAGAAAARACIMIKGLPARSRYAVNNLTISNCEMYDCGNGISIWGSWNDSQTPWCETEEEIDPVYNKGVLVEYCNFHDMDAEAIIVGMCDGALVTHCKAINCCQGEGTDENGKVIYYNAAMWFWGSENSTIEYCEIAGQKNVGDGMAVDFDSHSNNCTYQYIYSHDNQRFMCNCANYSGQHGNTVRYCLSVNDNKGRSRASSGSGEYHFRFYNNTIINCSEMRFQDIHDSVVVNNIIVPADGQIVEFGSIFDHLTNTIGNNCYYNCLTPLVDFRSMNTNPGFSGTDFSVKESAELVSNSPLIGSGIQVEDNELTKDFFGNAIASNNIGCDASAVGADGDYTPETLFAKTFRMLKVVFLMIKNFIVRM